MKIFLIWPTRDPHMKTLISELEKGGCLAVYWVCHPTAEKYGSNGTVVHRYTDAMLGLTPKEIDISEFSPPSAEILNKFHDVESVVLTMMNRTVAGWRTDERKHLYYTMLRYWLGVFKKYKPDAVIFPISPHFVYDYVIYALARFFGVKTICFYDTPIPGRALLYGDDILDGSKALREAFNKNKNQKFSVRDLAKDIREYYEPRIGEEYDAVPSAVMEQKRNYSVFHQLFLDPSVRKSFRDFSFFYKAPRYAWNTFKQKKLELLAAPAFFARHLFLPNLKKEYRSVETRPDFAKKFVYVPLHMQPECTTSPEGGVFVDQILMLETASAAVPDDWIIYVKEHPIQWLRFGIDYGDDRYRGYYQKMVRIPKVRIVPANTNSYELIRRSQAVVTVASSAAWESALLSKPAVIFGYPWFQHCPGILKADGVESCKAALEKIVSGFKIDRQEIINYLKSYEEASIPAFIDHSAGRGSALSREESMKNIAQVVLKELKIKN